MSAPIRALTVVLAVAASVGARGDGNVAGAYVFGHEVRSFQPCGSSRIYWAKPVDPGISRLLRERHTELAVEPYGRIYVVVTGRPTEERPTGFAESYDGYFEISQVHRTAAGIPSGCGLD